MYYAQLLFPDFSLILIGYLICRFTPLNRPVWAQVEQLVYFLFFPVLLFHSIIKSPLDIGAAGNLLGAGWALGLGGIALAYSLPYWPGLKSHIAARQHAASAQIAFRFNSFIGLALAERLAGPPGLLVLALLIGISVPLMNIGAVWPMARHAQRGFADWALAVDGLVRRPLALPLAALQAMRQRVQITRHDCVEGWSAIAQWQGVPLGLVLAHAGLMPDARYIVFHCADRLGGDVYYESIDLVDGFHPLTILAHRMNGQPLAVAHGAPLRLRVERQLGYKHAKYVMRIELVAGLDRIGGGRGGYWEDRRNYDWYAGI